MSITEIFHISHIKIEWNLKTLGYVYRYDVCVSHLNLMDNQNNPFLNRMITDDEKYPVYSNM